MTAINYAATKGLLLRGDEVGAWMVDTTAETLVGAELITDGDMSSTTNWTAGNSATLSIVSGKLRVAYNGVANPYAYQAYTTVVGQTYTFASDGVYTADGFVIGVGTSAPGVEYGDSGTLTANETWTLTFVATTTTTYVRLLTVASASGYAEFDNATSRLAVPDLSANENGLGVYGSITKSAVNTGADLMAYSGFSASNYLEQPYNADFDVGTGDIGTIGWYLPSSTPSGNEFLLERGGAVGTNINIYVTSSNILTVRFAATVIGTYALTAGVSVLISLIRRSGVGELHINDALVTTTASSDNLTDATASLYFGIRSDVSAPLTSGSLALWRVMDYAPTAAQILAIYESEKILFQKNRVYTQVDESYQIDITHPQELTRNTSEDKAVQRAKGGQSNTLVFRSDGFWAIKTQHEDRDDFDCLRRFLDSVADGQIFTLDPYGTVAAEDEPFSVEIESNGYTEDRDGPRLLSASFRVREV